MKSKQEIKEEAKAKTQVEQNDLEKPLPKLKFTEKELDSFAESLATGIPFSKEFFHPSAKNFKVVFRDKKKRENEIISRALDKEMDAKNVRNWTEYTHLFNMSSMYYQLESINGIDHIRQYPVSIYSDFDLLGALEKSPISEWNASQTYIAMGFMFQFNSALLDLAKIAFGDENFS